ncbi:MAG: phospholipase D-like domain-containing protein [Puniceicoccaceae bacterium]
MRAAVLILLLLFLAMAAAGFFHVRRPLPKGLDFRGPARVPAPGGVTFLADVTGARENESGRWIRHEIFDEVIRRIDAADAFVVADFFLVNEFAGGPPEGAPGGPSLSRRLVDALAAAKRRRPAMPVILITDPLNTLYGAVRQPFFEELRSLEVEVVPADLRRLRDSNMIFSPFWRVFFSWWGDPRGDAFPNPIGEGRIGLAAMLELLNFKANHRKTLVTGMADGSIHGLVTSGNPHSASVLHGNVALAFDGALAADLLRTEEAVYRYSTGSGFPEPVARFLDREEAAPAADGRRLAGRVLTERAIKRELLDRIDRLDSGDEADLALFYFSDIRLRNALAGAAGRGARVRLLMDPNKDAFGRRKNGIPNRQVGAWLAARSVEVRWYRTQGEQFHTKMALFRFAGSRATLALGSANWTRRNLNNLNLETNVSVSGPADDPVFAEASEYFSLVWSNAYRRGLGDIPSGLRTSLPFEAFRDDSRLRRVIYWLMERTGAGTF